jgi:hypothetical protein
MSLALTFVLMSVAAHANVTPDPALAQPKTSPGISDLPSNPLQGLPALHKPHYSWPFPAGTLSNESEWFRRGTLHDYVRITGSCPIAVDRTTLAEIEMCAALCVAAARNPQRCIALNFSPWYGPNFPGSDPTVTGAPEVAEMRCVRAHAHFSTCASIQP